MCVLRDVVYREFFLPPGLGRCADAEAREGAPGGKLSGDENGRPDSEGYRSLTMTIAKVGVYRVCHAFFNELATSQTEEQALPPCHLPT